MSSHDLKKVNRINKLKQTVKNLNGGTLPDKNLLNISNIGPRKSVETETSDDEVEFTFRDNSVDKSIERL